MLNWWSLFSFVWTTILASWYTHITHCTHRGVTQTPTPSYYRGEPVKSLCSQMYLIEWKLEKRDKNRTEKQTAMRTNCVLNVSNIALINMFSTHIVVWLEVHMNTMTIQCPSSPLLLLPSGQGRDLHWYLHRHTWVCNVGIHTSTGVSPSWELTHKASLAIDMFDKYTIFVISILYSL